MSLLKAQSPRGGFPLQYKTGWGSRLLDASLGSSDHSVNTRENEFSRLRGLSRKVEGKLVKGTELDPFHDPSLLPSSEERILTWQIKHILNKPTAFVKMRSDRGKQKG
jgi:hypothetical protein